MRIDLLRPLRFLPVSSPRAALLAASLAACSGQIRVPETQGPPGQGLPRLPPGTMAGGKSANVPAPAARPTPGGSCVAAPGPAPLRRLTRAEYDRTVADLLGDKTAPAQRGFDPDARIGAFESNAASPPSELLVGHFRDAAETMAAVAAPKLWTEAGCAVNDVACAPRFVAAFGRRAFRRPLTQEETARYLAMFEVGGKNRPPEAGARRVVQALLQSPHFLYHVESWGPPDPKTGVAALEPYSVAARLSYFLWGTMPDAELLQAAAEGRLDTAGVAAQAERLLGSPRARLKFVDFHEQWLGVRDLGVATVDQKRHPGVDQGVLEAMLKESADFVGNVIAEDGSLARLLTAPATVLNAGVARIYGVRGTEGALSALDPTQRAGLLTQPAFLTATHGPILRGKLVRTRLLCDEVPPPPPEVDTQLPPARPNQSPRQRLAAHSENPQCRFCHKLMDPLGFAFDHYDEVGRWRTADGGHAVDATGELWLDGVDTAFDGAVDLLGKLAGSDEVAACVARQWWRYAIARPEDPADACLVSELAATFRQSGGDVRVLARAIATSAAFRTIAITP